MAPGGSAGTGWLLDCLAGLKHGNGAGWCGCTRPPDVRARGGAPVAFNFLEPRGRGKRQRVVARDAQRGGHLGADRLLL